MLKSNWKISMKTKKLIGFLRRRKLIVLILLVIGGLVIWRMIANRNGEVQTSRVERGSVVEELILSGSVAADQHADLSFLASGELDSVLVSEGDIVKKGQVLARLDATNLYQTYLQTEADLRYYQSVLDRVYDDVQGHEKDESFEQREDRTQAEANKDKAYRAFLIAQKNLSNASLKAPFDGIVASIANPEGINTNLTESQITIVNPQSLYFDVDADQTEIVDLSVGQKVIMTLDAFDGEDYEGAVESFGYIPKSGEIGSIYRVKIRFNSLPNVQKVRVGMTGDAKFVLKENEDVLYVPSAFIQSDDEGDYVIINSKNNKVYIEKGLEGEDRVEIKGEIKEGDTVYDYTPAR